TEVADPAWPKEHWSAIAHNYARAPYFGLYRERLEQLYLGCEERLLSRVNRRFLDAVCNLLGITTRVTWSMDYRLVEGRTERLVDLGRQAGATRYLSGPAARVYIDEAIFAGAGVELAWMDYAGYPK